MKVLMIGGTGNISADCAARLHSDGHDVSVLTRGRTPVPAVYTALQGDCRDVDSVKRAIAGHSFETVLNFLAFVPEHLQVDREVFGDTLKQYIFISSATVYAKPHTGEPITEDFPLGNPYSAYAQDKQRCEEWLVEQHREQGYPVTIVRPSHTFSRRWLPNTVTSKGYTVAARIEAGKPLYVPDAGTTPWTLTSTTDFAVALSGLVGNPEAVGEVFHITSDEALTWPAIYAAIARATGSPQPELVYVPTDFICERFPKMAAGHRGDKSNPAVFDNRKIKRFVPGFSCRKSIEDGIRESVQWMRSHPEDKRVDPKVDQTFDDVINAWRQHAQEATP